MKRTLIAGLSLAGLTLSVIACDQVVDAFCGGSLEEFCADNSCVWTWEEALEKGQSDTGDFRLVGCTEEALLAHGYLHGRTHYYDGATGELEAVVEWSDYEEFCSSTSSTREWGEHSSCDWSCTYDEDEVSENNPLCEDAAAR